MRIKTTMPYATPWSTRLDTKVNSSSIATDFLLFIWKSRNTCSSVIISISLRSKYLVTMVESSRSGITSTWSRKRVIDIPLKAINLYIILWWNYLIMIKWVKYLILLNQLWSCWYLLLYRLPQSQAIAWRGINAQMWMSLTQMVQTSLVEL